jgi:hypothetical protein
MTETYKWHEVYKTAVLETNWTKMERKIQAAEKHDSNPSQSYAFEKEVRAVLSDFGISEELIASHLKLLARMNTGERLKFPPMDVPRNELLSKGFRL